MEMETEREGGREGGGLGQAGAKISPPFEAAVTMCLGIKGGTAGNNTIARQGVFSTSLLCEILSRNLDILKKIKADYPSFIIHSLVRFSFYR